MKTKSTILILLCFLCLHAGLHAQGTLKMMQYNLMYYTDNSGVSDCNSTTNNLSSKDANIRTIFHYVMPDVFCVCEMGSNISYVERLLNNAINTDGVDYYRHCPLTNFSGGQISNMLYYDSRKLTFHSHTVITTSYRDINGYKMYYNADNLADGADTIFITFWIMHLKAGSSESNAAARHTQTKRLMNKISSMGNPGNYVVSGDFNTYTADEAAYQEMVNYSNSLYRLYDPVDRAGNWNNNGAFSDVHTQSTHTYSDGCFSSGGLDDRFDIILVSPYIYYGVNNVQVRPETYHALGQDGMRFNGSVLSPENTSVPTDVANALYNQSDHLPIITEFSVNAVVGVADHPDDFYMRPDNPVRDNLLTVRMQTERNDTYTFELYSAEGRRIANFTRTLDAGAHAVQLPFDYPAGLYLLKVVDSDRRIRVGKLIN